MKNTIFTTIIFILLTGCSKDFSVDINDIEKRMVLYSLFTPDSVFRINLTEEASLNDNIFIYDFSVIDNAVITIYENGQIIDTAKYNADDKLYFTTVKPDYNKNYNIKVIAPNYNSTEAVNSVPKKVEIDTIIDYKKENNIYYNHTVDIIFNDPKEEENYYLIYIGWISEGSNIPFIEAKCQTNDPAIGEWHNLMRQLPIFTDEIFNGQKYKLTFDIKVNGNSTETGDCLFQLFSVSKEFYLNFASYNNQQPEYGDDLMQMLESGLTEPIPIYTNVDNGLGVFAGYSVSRYIYRFE